MQCAFIGRDSSDCKKALAAASESFEFGEERIHLEKKIV
jgi:hypothetical protein